MDHDLLIAPAAAVRAELHQTSERIHREPSAIRSAINRAPLLGGGASPWEPLLGPMPVSRLESRGTLPPLYAPQLGAAFRDLELVADRFDWTRHTMAFLRFVLGPEPINDLRNFATYVVDAALATTWIGDVAAAEKAGDRREADRLRSLDAVWNRAAAETTPALAAAPEAATSVSRDEFEQAGPHPVLSKVRTEILLAVDDWPTAMPMKAIERKLGFSRSKTSRHVNPMVHAGELDRAGNAVTVGKKGRLAIERLERMGAIEEPVNKGKIEAAIEKLRALGAP